MRDSLVNRRSKLLASLALCGFFVVASAADAVEIYSDNFDDNTNTGWTYLDRSAGTALAPVIGGTGAPTPTPGLFVEQNGQLEQTVTNYTFPNNGGPSLGGIALSGSGSVGGIYTISVDMDSLEDGNGNQDQDIIFGYTDEDNFFYVETIANGGRNLFGVISGVRTALGGAGGNTFSHDLTNVVLTVDTAAGDVSLNYGGGGDVVLATGLTLSAGLNGVGSNNDAFAIDNYVVEQIPEPASFVLMGLAGLLIVSIRRT